MNTIQSDLADFPVNKNKKRYKVLLCAGGGLFGYIITYFMSHLDYDVYEKIDVAAGTSIGGILTLFYTCNGDYKYINDLFKQKSPYVFEKKPLGKLACPRYDNTALQEMISLVVGDYTLADIKELNDNRLNVIIPTLDMTLVQPRTFTNIGLHGKDDPRNVKLSTLGLYTSAAPTYFPVLSRKWSVNDNIDLDKLLHLPTYNQQFLLASQAARKMKTTPNIQTQSAITDGGVIQNIPVITTYTTLKSMLGINPEDIDMLILGTGDDYNKTENLTDKDVNTWTLFDWLFKFIIPFVTESNETTSINWGAQMGFHSFKFFNPLNVTGSMDDCSILPDLQKQCDPYIEEFKKTIDEFLNK